MSNYTKQIKEKTDLEFRIGKEGSQLNAQLIHSCPITKAIQLEPEAQIHQPASLPSFPVIVSFSTSSPQQTHGVVRRPDHIPPFNMSDFAPGPVPALALSPCSTRIAAAAGQNHLSLVSLPPPPPTPLSHVPFPRTSFLFPAPSLTALCFPSTSSLYIADARGSFKRLTASSNLLSEDYAVVAAHSGDELTGIAALSATSPVATSGKDGTVRLWDPETRQSIAKLSGHRYEVRDVAVASSSDASGADVTIIASAGRDKTVRLWDVRAGSAKEVHCFRGHAGWVHAVALGSTHAGPIAVSCGGDKTVRVWDLVAMKERTVMKGHEYRVWGLALASDASFAVTGSTDATVRAWSLGGRDEGECHVYEGHRDSVLSVDVSRNGMFAVSGCEDGALYLWDCATLFGRDARKEVETEGLIEIDAEPSKVTEVASQSRPMPKQLDPVPLVAEKAIQEDAVVPKPPDVPAATATKVAEPATSPAKFDAKLTTDGLKAAVAVSVEQDPKFDKSAAELVNALKRIKELETLLAEAKEQLTVRDREVVSLRKTAQEKDAEVTLLRRQIESSQNLVNAANVRALLAANPRKADESLDYEEPVNKIGAVSDQLSALAARLDAMIATN